MPRFAGPIVSLGLVLALLVPAAADAAPASRWGWVVVRDAAALTPGVPWVAGPRDQGNSTGATNTVTRATTVVGRYLVTFPDLADGPVGTVNVAMVGTRTETCSVEQPFPNGNDIRVSVNCFGLTPAAPGADSTFLVTYASVLDTGGGRSAIAYIFGDPNGPPLTSYNSKGKGNSVTRLDFGLFRVRLGGMAGLKGHLQASPWSKGVVCSVVDASDGRTAKLVRVQCLSIAGVGQDVRFHLTFLHRAGLKGFGGAPVAYLLANRPTASAYTPAVWFSSAGGDATPRVTRTGRGEYRVRLPGMERGGAANITTLGAPRKRCIIRDVRRDALPQYVNVQCLKLDGTRADAPFYLTYVR
ncbi:MAG: hypothetical protein R6W93_13720 [Candidatus Limnocylindrales bacterium]